MQRRSMFRNDRGITLLEMFVILILLLLVAAILFPVLARPHRGCGARKSTCQNNLKELVTALHMYWTDYDGMMPSSILHDPLKSKKWDPRISAEFCSERGTLPPPEDLTPRGVRWVQLLYPHMKNKDIIWCPSDPDKTTGNGVKDRQTMVSYIYKPAVDRAWFGSMCPVDPSKPTKDLRMKCFRREGDFEYVADQIVLFEKKGWHWGDQDKGWSEGVSLNAAFLDGHVRNVRLKEAVNKPVPKDSAELARYLMMDGEPMYYNYAPHSTDPARGKHIQGQCCDPRIYCDNLP